MSTASQFRTKLEGHGSEVLGLALSPDVQLLASASRDRTVRLWAMPNGQEIAALEGHRGAVNTVAFSPEGKRLASAGMDLNLKIWDLETRTCTHSQEEGHMGGIESAAWHPDGQTLAVGWNMWSFGHVTLWNVSTWESPVVCRVEHGQLISGLDWSPDGELLAAAIAVGTIKAWNRAGEERFSLRGHGEAVHAARWSLDGSLLASAGAGGLLKVWKLGEEATLLHTFKGHEGAVFDLVWSPDGAALASVGADGRLIVHRLSGSRDLVGMIPGSSRAVVWLDEQTLAAGSKSGDIYLWEYR